MSAIEKRLQDLAGKNPARVAALAARKERTKHRWRIVTCPACGEKEPTHQDKADICDACLVDLWGAQNVLKGAYDASKKSGLVPVSLPGRWHDIEYPHTATYHEHPPKGAHFARQPHNECDTANTSATMQLLYHEVLTALSEAMPCDPETRKHAEPLLPGGSSYDDSKVFARVPKAVIKALRDLWGLILWHSAEAYQQGFDAGHNLLGRMNLGDATFEQFQASISKQVKDTRETQEKIARGRQR